MLSDIQDRARGTQTQDTPEDAATARPEPYCNGFCCQSTVRARDRGPGTSGYSRKYCTVDTTRTIFCSCAPSFTPGAWSRESITKTP